MAKPLTRADDRPRIYIERMEGQLHSWRVGQHVRPTYASTAGDALQAALSSVGFVPSVIFYGDEQ